jgi:hypothetical protein
MAAEYSLCLFSDDFEKIQFDLDNWIKKKRDIFY